MPSQAVVDWEVGLGPQAEGRGCVAPRGLEPSVRLRLSLEGVCGVPEAWPFGKTQLLEASSGLIQ